MRTIITVWLAVFCWSLAPVSFAEHKAQAGSPENRQQSVTVSNIVLTVAITNKCLAGEAILVRVSLQNQSDKNVYFIRGFRYVYDALNIKVFNTNGGSISMSAFGKNILNDIDNQWRNGCIQLEPGEEIFMDINLARLFDLTKTGQYLLAIETYANNNIDIIGFPITLAVAKLPFEVSDFPDAAHRNLYDIEKHLKSYGKPVRIIGSASQQRTNQPTQTNP